MTMAAEAATADLERRLADADARQHGMEAECRALRQTAEMLADRAEGLAAVRAAQEVRVEALRAACLQMMEHAAVQERQEAAIESLSGWLAQRRVLAGLFRRAGAARIALVRAQAEQAGVGPLVSETAIIWAVRRRALLGLLRRSRGCAAALIARRFGQEARAHRVAAAARLTAPATDATLEAFLERYLAQG